MKVLADVRSDVANTCNDLITKKSEGITRNLLFALKLELFEYETIKKSDNSKYKSLIRKAQSPYEVLKYAVEIIEYENQKKDTSQKT